MKFQYNKNQTGMFVWAKIFSKFKDAEQFSDVLLKHEGIFITPGSIFGSNGKRFIRISLCSEINTLIEARNKIFQFVDRTDFIKKEDEDEYEMIHFKFH